MRSIINFCLKNKFAVWIIVIVVLATGLVSARSMKLESMPNITFPAIQVSAPYLGASPQEVQDKLTVPIEQAVSAINGVQLVTSTSYQGFSSVQVQFDYDVDLDKSQRKIEQAMANLSLPQGVETPTAMQFSLDQIPILIYGVSSKGTDMSKLTKLVENSIVPGLESIDGIQSVDIAGQQLQEITIQFNQESLAKYGYSEETVTEMIQASASKFPLGVTVLDGTEKSIVVDGEINTIDDLKNIELPKIPVPNQAFEPGMVKLSDIADVKLSRYGESLSRTNGVDAISLSITKSSSGNTVKVAHQVTDKLEKYEKDFPGIKFHNVLDSAKPIELSVETMVNKAVLGALFAVIIIWLFLRSFKATIIAVVSIPLSLLIATSALHALDISLNMMTLGAMTVAIGRVIDDSIVVIENIFRRMSLKTERLTGAQLIREATMEVIKPVTSSTLVTIAVFFPLGLVTGMVGEIFMPFALAIVFSLLASLIVAITVVPMLTHLLYRKGIPAQKMHDEGKHSKLASNYRHLLEWSLNRKWIPISICIVLLVGSLSLVATGLIGMNFLSNEDQKYIYLEFKPEPGSTEEQVVKEVEKAEKLFLSKDDVSAVQVQVGGENFFTPGANKNAVMTVQYKDETENFTKEKEKEIMALQQLSDGGKWTEPDWGMGDTSGRITYLVYGKSMNDIAGTVQQVEKVLNSNKDLKNVSSTLEESYDEYVVHVNQQIAATYGLSSVQVGMALFQNPQRQVVTTINGTDVYVAHDESTYHTIDELENQEILTPLGTPVKLSDIATIEKGKTSDTITHRDGKVYASVSGTPKTKDVKAISTDVQQKIEKLDLPSGVSVDQGGVNADMAEAFTQLGYAMLAAIAIVYLILVITFGGALAPFAILFSLPLTIIGALFGLFVTGGIIETTVLIGMLMLIGIVVTNAIVLIDKVVHKEGEGLSTREALLEAGVLRLRPILMTAIATIAALLPLALGYETSGIISSGLAITVIGGLISSTLLTLVIVPIVYELLSRFRRRKVITEEIK